MKLIGIGSSKRMDACRICRRSPPHQGRRAGVLAGIV